MYPSNELLEMEQKANDVFERYAKLYYDNNYFTSVYFFDTDDNGFGSCWLIKKSKFRLNVVIFVDMPNDKGEQDSSWDAIHVVKTNVDAQQKAKYKVNSTVFLIMKQENEIQGSIDVAGNVNRLKEDLVTVDPKMDIQ